ncbi:MAG: transposase [Gammaproteobacteria bacterium]|nr:transposase [Gammaproteobacteria bacterium]
MISEMQNKLDTPRCRVASSPAWHLRNISRTTISGDGKGAWWDNVFVERLWRTVKYEHVYLHAYDSTGEAKSKSGGYFEFYNQRRPHSKLDRLTPDQFYFNSLTSQEAA